MRDKKLSGGDVKFWLLLAASWLLSLYLLIAFHMGAGFPPSVPSNPGLWLYLAIALILLSLPFVSRIRVGNILDLERRVEHVNEKVDEFRQEVRQAITVIASSVTAISNVSNTVNVSLPPLGDLMQAQRRTREVTSDIPPEEAAQVKEELLLDDEETILPLARTRILIEQLLRRILGKRIRVPEGQAGQLRFLSARALFHKFLELFPQNRALEEPFDHVMRVCNAAIHGQRVPPQDADIALDIGADIIAFLSDLADKGNP